MPGIGLYSVFRSGCWLPFVFNPLRWAEGLSYTFSFVNPPRNPIGKRNKSLANAIWPEVDALRPTKTRRLL